MFWFSSTYKSCLTLSCSLLSGIGNEFGGISENEEPKLQKCKNPERVVRTQ